MHTLHAHSTWPYETGVGKTTLVLADIQPLQDGCYNGNNAYSTFGAALPWRYVCKQYGSRDAYVQVGHQHSRPMACPIERASRLFPYSNPQAVYDAWYGTSKAPVCFEVQPINRVPASISDGSYDQPSLATNPNAVGINSDGIVAKQQNGAPYPKFQLVPYEGCGGNVSRINLFLFSIRMSAMGRGGVRKSQRQRVSLVRTPHHPPTCKQCIWQPGTLDYGKGSTEDCFNGT